jgi:hypothetical protein
MTQEKSMRYLQRKVLPNYWRCEVYDAEEFENLSKLNVLKD